MRHPVEGPNSGVLMECWHAAGENQDKGPDDNAGAQYLYALSHPGSYGGVATTGYCSYTSG